MGPDTPGGTSNIQHRTPNIEGARSRWHPRTGWNRLERGGHSRARRSLAPPWLIFKVFRSMAHRVPGIASAVLLRGAGLPEADCHSAIWTERPDGGYEADGETPSAARETRALPGVVLVWGQIVPFVGECFKPKVIRRSQLWFSTMPPASESPITLLPDTRRWQRALIFRSRWLLDCIVVFLAAGTGCSTLEVPHLARWHWFLHCCAEDWEWWIGYIRRSTRTPGDWC